MCDDFNQTILIEGTEFVKVYREASTHTHTHTKLIMRNYAIH